MLCMNRSVVHWLTDIFSTTSGREAPVSERKGQMACSPLFSFPLDLLRNTKTAEREFYLGPRLSYF